MRKNTLLSGCSLPFVLACLAAALRARRVTTSSERPQSSAERKRQSKAELPTAVGDQVSSINNEASHPVGVDFQNLTFTVGKKTKKVILNKCSGSAAPGRMLAIMGPSGSGKTTLLNALAGQLRGGSSATLEGTLFVDGELCGGASQVPGLRVAYVRQEDSFYSQMTVRETLLFAARLRLPSSIPFAVKERRVEELIEILGLAKAANTIVGNAKRRGISGGERKRLAIGCELLSDPQLLFLDEPTSGLDAFAAQQVVDLLKRLADAGTTVIMAIHQPRGSIFNLFDDLLLLAEGRVMYSGPANAVAHHFAALGHKCPAGINPGEFVVDLVSTGYDKEHAGERLGKFEAAAKKLRRAVVEGSPRIVAKAARDVQRVASSGFTQFGLLLKRAWREVARSRTALAIKIVQQLMIALIYGGIYSLDNSQSSIQDRYGLMSLVAIGAGNMAIGSTIRAFPKEKVIVNNERAKGMYSVLPYFLSKVVAEAPISAIVSALGGALLYPLVGLNRASGKFAKYICTVVLEGLAASALGLLIGAVAPTTDTALALFPPIIVLMIVFNGFNIAEENAPRLLRWLPKVSFIRWCFEGLTVNEFTGLTFSTDRKRGPVFQTGEQALDFVSFGESTVKGAAISQAKLTGACYLATLLVLQRNKPKFLSAQAPSSADSDVKRGQ